MSLINWLDRLIHGTSWTMADKRVYMAAHKPVSLGYRRLRSGDVVEMFGPPGSQPIPCPRCGLLHRWGCDDTPGEVSS
jgi:hypothetical protein